MYVPSHFQEDRPAVLRGLMDEYALATLISHGETGLVANHVPLLFDASGGPHGVLRGHMARANTQWRELESGEVLAIFQGPQAYVSPDWYPTKHETGNAVPTWNYVTVHVWGRVRVIEEPEWLLGFLRELTARHEQGRPTPWAVDDAPAGYVENLVRAIVGMEMQISRIEGKWKVSQNQPERNRAGAAAGLEAECGAAGRGMADLIRSR